MKEFLADPSNLQQLQLQLQQEGPQKKRRKRKRRNQRKIVKMKTWDLAYLIKSRRKACLLTILYYYPKL